MATWLDALGLGDLAPNFLAHNVDGGTVFLLTEEHLKELGFNLVGDRLYFIEVLTQLYDDIVNWSSALGIQLATHPVPPLRKLGLSLQPTSWTVKDVCKVQEWPLHMGIASASASPTSLTHPRPASLSALL